MLEPRARPDAALPEAVVEAAEDLRLDEGEEGLSVYRVEGEAEALEVALRFAMTLRPKAQRMRKDPERRPEEQERMDTRPCCDEV